MQAVVDVCISYVTKKHLKDLYHTWKVICYESDCINATVPSVIAAGSNTCRLYGTHQIQHRNATIADDDFFNHFVFSEESTYHLSDKVNRYNVHIWRTENQYVTVQHDQNMAKIILTAGCVLCDERCSHWAHIIYAVQTRKVALSSHVQFLLDIAAPTQ